MKYFKELLFLLFITVMLRGDGQNIIGYYPYWVTDFYSPNNIPTSQMTHLVHSFMWPEADGSVGHPDQFFSITPSLINIAHNNNCKVMVSIGGAGYGIHFDAVFADAEKRKKFINELVEICQDYGYDGIDIDWEQPDSHTDKQNLNLFVQELSDKIADNLAEISISIAVPASDWRGKYYDAAFLKNYVSWFGVMTYDFYGSWSNVSGHNSSLYKDPGDPQYLTIDSAIREYWHNTKKVPYNQLVSGIPFYGYKFAGAAGPYQNFTSATYVSYRDIQSLNQYQYIWNSDARVPYRINSNTFITYDDTLSVRYKCEYAREKKLGGVMIWEISQDFFNPDEQPLLNTVIREMHKTTAIIHAGPEISTDFSISQNYPNPFNAGTCFKITIADDLQLQLSIYDINGHPTETLYNDKIMAGTYDFLWTAHQNITSGVYFLKAKSKNNVQSVKMVYLK
ncbi:MAG: T9SS type A sorting domain-containing protein [Candidatus Marinimicrobia bacterium]|nr:T9SS type A sorting domain-containing protein [Candidatus Neomarinimicrobiota bacterium]